MTIERQPDTGALEELSMDELAQVAGGSSRVGSGDDNGSDDSLGVPNPPGDRPKGSA